jgi:hypothetical protein
LVTLRGFSARRARTSAWMASRRSATAARAAAAGSAVSSGAPDGDGVVDADGFAASPPPPQPQPREHEHQGHQPGKHDARRTRFR